MASMIHNAPLQEIKLSGSHYDIGYQHGTALRERIHVFLNDNLCRINAILATPIRPDDLKQQLAAYATIIQQHLPGLDEELRGLSDGADISYEQALLLQVRRELTGYNRVQTNGDCTSFAVGHGADTCLAQTIDLNGNMRDELSVLRIHHHRLEAPNTVLLVSFTGLIGYLGMNNSGLAIGLNLVLGGTWEPGIPGYMAIRHLLDQAATVEEALKILEKLPLASSRSLLLCDSQQKVYVEYIRNKQHVLAAPSLIHANHFLHPAFQSRDELNPLAAAFSRQREQACSARLAAISDVPTLDDCITILSEPPIYVVPKAEIRREETVAMVAMRPATGTLLLRVAGNNFNQTIDLFRG